jgi:hypothetical protein
MPCASEAATDLSHLGGASLSNQGRITALARESLIVAFSMFAVSGCLVSDPPEYKPPEQTPPFLDLFRADPLIRDVLVVRHDETKNFNVPVRSEDAGDDLIGAVHFDWGLPQSWQKNVVLPASTFDDHERAIVFDWSVTSPTLTGCHQLTLLVFHRSNYDFINQRSTDSDDQAIATWWLNVNPAESELSTLKDCHVTTPGAGP